MRNESWRSMIVNAFQTRYWFYIKAKGLNNSPIVSFPEKWSEYWIVLILFTLIFDIFYADSLSSQQLF